MTATSNTPYMLYYSSDKISKSITMSTQNGLCDRNNSNIGTQWLHIFVCISKQCQLVLLLIKNSHYKPVISYLRMICRTILFGCNIKNWQRVVFSVKLQWRYTLNQFILLLMKQWTVQMAAIIETQIQSIKCAHNSPCFLGYIVKYERQ